MIFSSTKMLLQKLFQLRNNMENYIFKPNASAFLILLFPTLVFAIFIYQLPNLYLFLFLLLALFFAAFMSNRKINKLPTNLKKIIIYHSYNYKEDLLKDLLMLNPNIEFSYYQSFIYLLFFDYLYIKITVFVDDIIFPPEFLLIDIVSDNIIIIKIDGNKLIKSPDFINFCPEFLLYQCQLC